MELCEAGNPISTDKHTGLDSESRLAVYRFYADLFLSPIPVPGTAFAENLGSRVAALLASGEGEPSLRTQFEHFVADCENAPEATQTELALDRSMLLRATKQAKGPLPPREGLYRLDRPEKETIQHVNLFYARFGSGLAEGVHESPDYIGIESAFMAELIAASLDAAGNADETVFWIKAQRDFLERHMLVWVPDCCNMLAARANTDAFAGLLYLFRDFIEQERFLLCER